jgi:hypothetical protein
MTKPETSKSEKAVACQEQIHYTIDPVGEGTPVGSFYCILSKGHEGPHRIFTPNELDLGEEEPDAFPVESP